MTRRPAESTQNAVSLFPFLAVLLCTMGSLILMLMVIARQARSEGENARAAAAAKAPVDAAKLDERRDELNWEIERLAESRKKTAEQLAEQRANLSHLEEHAQRLRGEIAELTSAEKLLDEKSTLDAGARDRLLADVEELRRRAAEIEAKAADAKAKGKRPPAFAIIPYDGENGTRRRPIYIECRDNSIILQPEGIVFQETDFAGSLGPSNPLAACVRVVAEHHARTANLDTAAQPYPLLLVRPGGIGAYYAARAAMSSWDSDFGYELIDADWPLEFPPPDPNLTQVLARTQEEARRRQSMIARAAPTLREAEPPSFQIKPENGGEGGGPGGRYAGGGGAGPTGPGGGVGPNGPGDGGSPGGGYGGGGGARYNDVATRDQNRYADATGGNGNNPNGGGLYPNGSTGGGNGAGNGGGGLYPNGATGVGGAGYGTDLVGGNGTGGQGPALNGGGATGASSVPGVAGTGAPGSGDGPQLFGPGGGTPGTGGAGSPGVGGAGGPGAAAPGGAASATAMQGVGGAGNNHAGTGASGGNTFGTPNFEQPTGNGAGGNGPGGNGPNGSGANGNGANNVAGGPNGGATGGPGGSAAGGNAGGSQAGGASGGAGSPNGSPGGASGSSGAAGGGPSSSFAGGGSPGGAGGVPSLNFGDPSGGAPPNDAPSEVQGRSNHRVDSLARQRGENWGLPDYAKKATALTRPVQVYCSGDRLTVFSDRGIPDRQINLGPRTEDSVDELVSTVYGQKESWGIAGRNMYWRPVLSIHVAPDGVARFDELKTLLAGSGLEVTGKPIVMSGADVPAPRR